MKILFQPARIKTLPSLVGEARILFDSGTLKGMSLEGFSIWNTKGNITVTFPSRPYPDAKTGKTKYHWQLQATNPDDKATVTKLRATIVALYQEWLAEHEADKGIPF